MELDGNLALWSAIVGFIMPNVLAVIQQPGWSSRTRSLLAFVAALGAAAGTIYFRGEFNTEDILTSVLAIVVTAQATYQGLWKPSGVAPAIEQKTSSPLPTQSSTP